MIQRIQTVYLLIVALLCALLLVFPMVEIIGIGGEVIGEYTVWSPWVYHGVLVVLGVLVPVVAIFRYKQREFQMRMCVVEGVLLLGMIGFELMGYLRLMDMDVILDYGFVMLAPVVALPFVWMAYRGILSDLALIKSSDRIR